MLSFGNDADRTSHTRYYLPKVEINVYKVKIDSRKFFDQPINNNIKRYRDIRKIDTTQLVVY